MRRYGHVISKEGDVNRLFVAASMSDECLLADRNGLLLAGRTPARWSGTGAVSRHTRFAASALSRNPNELELDVIGQGSCELCEYM
jgi:hypothetical protein